MFHASVYAQRKKTKGFENRFQKKPQLDLFHQFLIFYFLVENSSLTRGHNFWFVRLNFENSTVPKNDFENGFLSLSTFTSPQSYWLRFLHENFIQHLSFCPVKSIWQCMAIVTGSKCKNVLLRLTSLEMQTYNFTWLLTW